MLHKRGATEVAHDRAAVKPTTMRAYFTRDTPEEKWIPKKLVAPALPKLAPKRAKQPAAKPAAASLSIPVIDGEHVQLQDCLGP